MAVQGDHNTIAKLTTQTLMGFSMEMDQAAEVTDKFAHVIQKSLIEYEGHDLEFTIYGEDYECRLDQKQHILRFSTTASAPGQLRG